MAEQRTSREAQQTGTPQPGRHDGRVAIITGSSRGIGKAVALRLAAEGAAVVVAAKSEQGSELLPGSIHDTVAEIESAGGRAVAVKVDVRSEDDLARMVDTAVERFGGVHLMFHNAGAIKMAPVAQASAKHFDLMMAVNARATLLASALVIPHMQRQRWGHILSFSPPLHTQASPGMAAYMASKFAMTRIAISIAEEHRADNIAGNSLWPMTMIESLATINNRMGAPEQWRSPAIICDAVSELLSREPAECTGRQLTDEEILREAGVTDFDDYWVTGAPPESPILIAGPESVMR